MQKSSVNVYAGICKWLKRGAFLQKSIVLKIGKLLIYIPDNNVAKGKGLIGNLMGKEFEMEFICSLKENYAQRMANMAYADSNRVGISLAHLPETSASED